VANHGVDDKGEIRMRPRTFLVRAALCILVVVAACLQAFAQAGFDDDRVLLQGFYWESHRHGQPEFQEFGPAKWYAIVRANAGKIREARFDMIWLPPPSYAGELSAGYNPKQYFRLDNSYGTFEQHRAMLDPVEAEGGSWSRIQATFPHMIPTHCKTQVFYFDHEFLLRRVDYTALVVGSWAKAAHVWEGYRDFGGIKAPTRRRVTPILFGNQPMPGPTLVALDIREIRPVPG